jgi:UPF0716 family protein affecting phage T7 exclusion
VPLSDHEQRLLEQMERALYAEDPKFADSLRKTRRTAVDRKRMILGVAGVVAGLAILLAGVATSLPLVGVLGFLATVAGAFVAYNAFSAKAATENGATAPQAPPKASAGNSALMDRLEERWRKRRDDRDQL